MSKFHINKHGVPAPCRATKGNCPLGGESGNENHFNTQEEAQAHADAINEAEHGTLPGMTETKDKGVKFKENELISMKTRQAKVEYDGKSFEGKVIGTHYDENDSGNTGVIIEDKDGNVKHIKSHRMTSFDVDYPSVSAERQAEINRMENALNSTSMTSREIEETGKRLTGLIDRRKNSVKEPNLPYDKDTIRSIDDVETLVHTRGEFISSEEHDPVKNVQSMFDHVANKADKHYRYDDDENPYLETHGYDFNKTMMRHEQYLERDGYFSEEYWDEDDDPKDLYEYDLSNHRKLHDYTHDLAVEYGKDFGKKVATSGTYNRHEQSQLKQEYKKALAEKVGKYVQNYGEDGYGKW